MRHKALRSRLNVTLVCSMLLAGGAGYLLISPKRVSSDEKRLLAQWPSASAKSLLSGDFEMQVTHYFADNVILREQFIAMSDAIVAIRGIPVNEEIITRPAASSDAPATSYVRSPEVAPDSLEASSPTEGSPGTILAPQDPPKVLTPGQNHATEATRPNDDATYDMIRSIVISEGRAIQIFASPEKYVEGFVKLLGEYRKALPPDVKIYCMAIPIGSDFFLPVRITHGILHEKNSIDHLYSLLDPMITPVDVYGILSSHRDDYIQFKTDHHWTALGAYYGYVAFAKAAGLKPLSLDEMERGDIKNFLGSLYYYTRSASLKKNQDDVIYYKIPNKTTVTVFRGNHSKGDLSSLYVESARGGNAYGVFLGGDSPLVRIHSDVNNRRRILVIKDSYGNAFVPYLAHHYEDTYVIDYRYYRGTIPELLKSENIGEIIFAHNLYVINSSFTVGREKALLSGK